MQVNFNTPYTIKIKHYFWYRTLFYCRFFISQDHEDVSAALIAMKDIATMINARRSRIEGLDSLVRLQESFDDWEGGNLVADSSALIHQVD